MYCLNLFYDQRTTHRDVCLVIVFITKTHLDLHDVVAYANSSNSVVETI